MGEFMVKSPTCLSFDGNVSQNWKVWYQKLDLYLKASGGSKKEDETKIAILLNLIGDDGLRIFNTFEFAEGEDKKKFEVVVKKFESHCNPIKNQVLSHFKFFSKVQDSSETFDEFLTELKTLISYCEFTDRDTLLRDRIILGIYDKKTQGILLQKADLTLADAINISRSIESSVNTQKVLNSTTINDNSVSIINKHNNSCFLANKNHKNGNYSFSRQNYTNNYSNKHICPKCGLFHEPNRCPAFLRKCNKCGQKGHYFKFCNKSNINEVRANDVYSDSDQEKNMYSDKEMNDCNKYVWSIFNKSVNAIEWTEIICINEIETKLKIDTGSDVNILNMRDFIKVGLLDQLEKPFISLTSYSGHKIPTLGLIDLNCCYSGIKRILPFYIVDIHGSQSILSLSGAVQLQIVKNSGLNNNHISTSSSINDLVTKYNKVFVGLGKVKTECKITLEDNAVPKICAARKVPFALKEKVRSKLNEMEQMGIIEKVSVPTNWVHPIVVANKPNGDIRICMDPRSLNQYIKREHFKIPSFEDLFSELGNSKIFSLLDASNAFLQVPLENKSSDLCTIATPYGRYKYLRMPFGICNAPEIFQKIIIDILDGLPGVIAYFDDILVFGKDEASHNKCLENVLKKISESGLTLNKDKSKFGVSEVKFLGHIINSNGIKVDVSKVKAILDMEAPKSRADLQRFLGMINYLTKFLPNLSDKTYALRLLLSTKSEWIWDSNHEKCFKELKSLVTATPVLSYFDPNKEITLSVDASQYGMGAVLLQDNHPIEFASVSLNKCQQKYSQIEKELFAIVFGCERFKYYLYGRDFIVQTDHQPLLGIAKKPIDQLSPRLQRLLLRLLRYKAQLVYMPGKKLQVADTLSRAPSVDVFELNNLDINLNVFSIIVTSDEKVKKMTEATENDEVLKSIMRFVLNGWPSHKNNVDIEVKKYWNIKNDIYLHKNVLFF